MSSSAFPSSSSSMDWPDNHLLSSINELAIQLFDSNHMRVYQPSALYSLGYLIKLHIDSLFQSPTTTTTSTAATTIPSNLFSPSLSSCDSVDVQVDIISNCIDMQSRRPISNFDLDSIPSLFPPIKKSSSKNTLSSNTKSSNNNTPIPDPIIHNQPFSKLVNNPDWCVCCRRIKKSCLKRLLYFSIIDAYGQVYMCRQCISTLTTYKLFCPNCYRVNHQRIVKKRNRHNYHSAFKCRSCRHNPVLSLSPDHPMLIHYHGLPVHSQDRMIEVIPPGNALAPGDWPESENDGD